MKDLSVALAAAVLAGGTGLISGCRDHTALQQTGAVGSTGSSAVAVVAAAPASARRAAGELRFSPKDQWPRPGRYQRFVRVDNQKRRFVVLLPGSFRRGQKPPVLMVLHGAGRGPDPLTDDDSTVARSATAGGFISVYPEGAASDAGSTDWMIPGCSASDSGVDEVRFLRTVIRELDRELRVGTRRVHLLGMGTGAWVAHRAATVLSEEVAALAAFGAVPSCATPLSDTTTRPRPVLVVGAGETDAGGPAGHPIADFWAKTNGCRPTTDVGAQDSGSQVYACPEDAPGVVWYPEATPGDSLPPRVGGVSTMRRVMQFMKGAPP